MKSKLLIILFSLLSFQQASCSLFGFENEFGDFINPSELSELSEELIGKPTEMIRQTLIERVQAGFQAVLSKCTVENYDRYVVRFITLAATAVSIQLTLEQIKAMIASSRASSRGTTCEISKGASKNWAGPLPAELEELFKEKDHYKALQEQSALPRNGYLFLWKTRNRKNASCKNALG